MSKANSEIGELPNLDLCPPSKLHTAFDRRMNRAAADAGNTFLIGPAFYAASSAVGTVGREINARLSYQ